MINYRNRQNYRFRTWKFRDRCHLKGGVRQGCFLSLILNNLIQYIHFHSLYITSHYYAKFKENPCVGTDARPPFLLSAHYLWCILFFIILLCSPCSMCMSGISISNKKGPNSFSAVFRKLNFK